MAPSTLKRISTRARTRHSDYYYYHDSSHSSGTITITTEKFFIPFVRYAHLRFSNFSERKKRAQKSSL